MLRRPHTGCRSLYGICVFIRVEVACVTSATAPHQLRFEAGSEAVHSRKFPLVGFTPLAICPACLLPLRESCFHNKVTTYQVQINIGVRDTVDSCTSHL